MAARHDKILRRIALVLPEFQFLTDDVIRGAIRFGRRSGRYEFRDVTFAPGETGPEVIDRLRQCRPDGIIMGFASAFYAQVQAALPATLPMVNIGADLLNDHIPAVCSDDQAILAMAADHLAAAGYEHFGYVGLQGSAVSQRRAGLFKKLVGPLAVYDMPWPSVNIPDEIPSDPAVERWLKRLKVPAGILSWTSYFAECILAACHSLGLDVPRDVGLISLVVAPRYLLGDPPISAVNVDGERMGYEAMKLLAGQMSGGPPSSLVLPVPPSRIVGRESTARTPGIKGNHIQQALSYIDDHACQGIDVSDVLKAIGPMARSKFYTEFTQGVGRSPKDQILLVRMNRACQLLAETAISIARVAAMCGFQSGARFSQMFSKAVGTTPLKYRQKHAQQSPAPITIASSRRRSPKRPK